MFPVLLKASALENHLYERFQREYPKDQQVLKLVKAVEGHPIHDQRVLEIFQSLAREFYKVQIDQIILSMQQISQFELGQFIESVQALGLQEENEQFREKFLNLKNWLEEYVDWH